MSEPAKPLKIYFEATPNPHSAKYVLSQRIILHTGYDFPDAKAAEHAPLALALFALPDVRGVYLGPNFVTVTTITEAFDSDRVGITKVIQDFVASGQPAVMGSALDAQIGAAAAGGKPRTELEEKIIRILDEEIRPAVAMDGGDIAFVGLENGVVSLQLKGSCHSCPSSVVTLKMGIEGRLKQAFPGEVEAVEAVQ